MANLIKHKKVSAKSDGGDATLVRPGNWNEEHVFGGGADTDLLTRDSGQSDGAAWVARSAVGGAAKPAFPLAPESATFPAANFPELKKTAGTNWVTYSLGYDTATEEAAYWRFKIPTTATFTAATVKIVSRQAAAVSGTVAWKLTSITRADGEAYDTAGVTDSVAAGTVKGTAGQLLFQTQALTITGWAAGEMLYVKLARDVANDTVAEDAELVEAVIELS